MESSENSDIPEEQPHQEEHHDTAHPNPNANNNNNNNLAVDLEELRKRMAREQKHVFRLNDTISKLETQLEAMNKDPLGNSQVVGDLSKRFDLVIFSYMFILMKSHVCF